MDFDFSVWLQRGPYILNGFWLTLLLVAAVMAASAPLALVSGMALVSKRRWLSVPSAIASWLVRGVPPLIILLISYFVLPITINLRLEPLAAAICGFTLYNTFIFAEVIASGLRAVPRGQHEAIAALGLPPFRALRRVVLPQAMQVIIPPYISYATDMVKSTALAGSIGVMELATRANQVIVATNRPFEILIGVALIYGAFDALLIGLQAFSERHFGRSRRSVA